MAERLIARTRGPVGFERHVVIAAARFWVGISDLTTENTFVTVNNTPQTFLSWKPGAPNNGPPAEHCVEIVSATSQINDARCSTQYVAVCECEP